MKSHTTKRFREAYQRLPRQVQRQTRTAYQRFLEDPFYPALRFKQIHPTKPIYSIRINIDYRAVGVMEGEEIIWYWIGSHSDYDKLLSQI